MSFLKSFSGQKISSVNLQVVADRPLAKALRLLVLLLLLALYVMVSVPSQVQAQATTQSSGNTESDSSESSMYSEAYFIIDALNRGLPAPPTTLNRQTPQATLELLILSTRNEEYELAAHALNFNLLPVAEQAALAPELAEQLAYVLNEQYIVDWDSLPDRPDGQKSVATGNQDPLAGVPRRSILLGTLDVSGRDVELRVQRVQAGDMEPVWVISPNTVENIDPLYAVYGPSQLHRMMPAWAQATLWSQTRIWEWLAFAVLLCVAAAVGWVTWSVSRRLLRNTTNSWRTELATKIPLPLALVVTVLIFYLPLRTYITLTGPFLSLVQPTFYILLVGVLLWLVLQIINISSRYFSHKYTNALGDDNIAHQRTMLTSVSVIRHVLVFMILVAGVGIALSEFRMFRTLGFSLLASAGVMSVIAAVAAQPVLGNLVAGMQIAATQPFRIGDTVMFDGNWSTVEDIGQAYVTLLTWDDRRIMVPLRHLMDHPIENWSKKDAHMLRPMYLYLDYRTDIEQLRRKFEELVRSSDDWDGRHEPAVQVTDTSDETVTVRFVAGGATPSAAWRLHCQLLEAMLRYVQELEDGRYLPHQRLLLQQNEAWSIQRRQGHNAYPQEPQPNSN